MTPKEIDKDKLVFFLKANDYKSKQLKNMKVEKLKVLVENVKKEKVAQEEKESGKAIQPKVVIQQGHVDGLVIIEELEKEREQEVTPSQHKEMIIPTVDEDPEERM
ncbi:hypothetical protein L1987_46566 [Smallanthus sonchifolius]|uniref:Uncharacterized protein n=1 Tax=Smallanthus sonchifolius TaxID=185202 RepID=A0ACB9FZY1_9ASTR|nr:hypothetical protein L1987_46566 [Smallanthus sonchifolius]